MGKVDFYSEGGGDGRRVDSSFILLFLFGKPWFVWVSDSQLKGGAHILAHVHESKCYFLFLNYQLYGLKNPTHMYFSNHIL